MLVNGSEVEIVPPTWALDDATICRIVGAETARQGRDYAQSGAVIAVNARSNGTAHTLLGTVKGNRRAPYGVTVHLGTRYSAGSCTCPMRTNCKHVAALLFEAGKRQRTPETWEGLLSGVADSLHPAPAEAISPVGIQFELTRRVTPAGPTAVVEMRPVVRGATGRWVRTGFTWSSLRYSQYGTYNILGTHHRILEEILALNSSGRSHPYSYGNQEKVFLDLFPSKRIWDILDEAAAAGVALVDAGKAGGPVALVPEPAVAALDVDATGAAWTVRSVISAQGHDIAPEASQLLGKPAHGVAWWTEADAAGPEPGISRLSIARLDRPLDDTMRKLFAGGGSITIPARDQPRFLREFFPGLRRRVTISSRNESFEIPAERTRLSLKVHHTADHRVETEWTRTHSVGDAHRELPLWPGTLMGPSDANGELEAPASEALAAVEEHTVAVGGLYQESPDGHRLADHSTLSDMDAIVFTRDVLPRLRDLDGVDVDESGVATEYREANDAPVINLTGKQGPSHDWFDLAVTISVDGEDVPFQTLFVALAENRTNLILPSGTYFSIDRPDLRQLRALIAEARGLTDQRNGSMRLTRFQASLWQELEALGVVSAQAATWSAGVRRLNDAQITVNPVPDSLHATLRPYQTVGFNWLAFLHEHGLGGVLADDMGLGKTLQALALICHAREHDAVAPPFLVVAPTSVVGNWASECGRFTPDLKALAVVATASRRGISLRRACRGMDVVITSYALFRIEFEAYARLKWSGLLLDEAQAIKNHQSRGYQCARKLPAPFKVAITGTPMENNLMELWSMFSITAPGLFSDPRHFTETYRNPIERGGHGELLAQLQRRMKPLLLRRTKDQVATDLPEKREQVIELDLNPRHRRVYETYLQRERQKVLGLIGDMQKNRFEIFRSLTLLRQVSIDPSLVDSKHRTVPSTKLDALLEQLADVIAEGHRALVFSQFTRFLGHVRGALDNEGIRYCYLDGATRNRPSVLKAFKTGDAPVFLISLKAGGVGLNLTEADYCFLLDPWWNPATEAQAVDRAHRIGQTRKVMVYRLVARDTIEEKVMALKAKKQALFSSVVDGGGATSSVLTAADIRALLD